MHLGRKGSWCSTTLLALNDPLRDPSAVYPARLLSEFAHIWRVHPDLYHDITRVWASLRVDFADCPDHLRWRRVFGPVSAALATLRDLGWLPRGPDYWVDNDAYIWDFDADPFDPKLLSAAIHRTV